MVHNIFPAFKNVRMYGGDPRRNQVDGYSRWNGSQGYISVHNPSDKAQMLTLKLDGKISVQDNVRNYKLSFPLPNGLNELKEEWSFGDVISPQLQPKEIRILSFQQKRSY